MGFGFSWGLGLVQLHMDSGGRRGLGLVGV